MKIAIAGYGVEGKVNYEYWRERGDVTIVDERETLNDAPAEAEKLLGAGVFGQLDDYDLVVRTASLAPRKITTGGKIWSATNEFFERCAEINVPIIGVTGTKGKGTTCSFIYSILQAAGKDVYLVGNIGTPALEILPKLTAESIVVYELSSFQLWDLRRSPHIAVVLPIEPDHLDIHADMDDYVAAKANITRHQTESDIVVYYDHNQWSRTIDAHSAAANKIAYPFDIDQYADAIRLPGAHNLDNACAAIVAVRSYTTDTEVIRQGLSNFTGLPHRLKFVATLNGAKYYDDSIGTTLGSSIAALNSFAQPKVLILGGSDKGADYAPIVEHCQATDTKIIAIGQTGAIIAELAQKLGVVCTRVTGLMSDVVAAADEMAHAGDVVILSPASASFDQYANYANRGDQFIAAVRVLAD